MRDRPLSMSYSLIENRRRKVAQVAALRRWARTGIDERRANMAPAQAALAAKWEREVDPEGLLDPDERRRRADALKQAHYIEMSLRSRGYVPAAERKSSAPRREAAGGE